MINDGGEVNKQPCSKLQGTFKLKKEIPILYKTINREEAINAVNKEIMRRTVELFNIIEQDESVFVVVLTGQARNLVMHAQILR